MRFNFLSQLSVYLGKLRSKSSLDQAREEEHDIDKACLQPQTAVISDLTLKLGCGSGHDCGDD